MLNALQYQFITLVIWIDLVTKDTLILFKLSFISFTFIY